MSRPYCSLLTIAFAVLAISTQPTHGWDNGLARTPPMGWMDWARVECNTDCTAEPELCVGEQTYRKVVDLLVSEGYHQLGYNTVNIDDCWMSMQRDPATNRLVPDPKRFPSGIPALVKYANSKGLQLGIYEAIAKQTCQGFPGTHSGGHDWTSVDAATFAEWGVGSLKLDGCGDKSKYPEEYPEYSRALGKASGNRVVFACSWPAYVGSNINYTTVRQHCNYWRNFNDIFFSWDSVKTIIEHYGENCHEWARIHGPGGWFDPDMLIIGNGALSVEQSKTQMAFWALWSAPLLMSNDLRNVTAEFKAILQNPYLIAVDQDPLGRMGTRVKGDNDHNEVWVKELAKTAADGKTPWVVLYFNKYELGVATWMSYRLADIVPGLESGVTYAIHDLFDDNRVRFNLTREDSLSVSLPNNGGVVRMFKLVPQSS